MYVTRNCWTPASGSWSVQVRTKSMLPHWLEDYFGELRVIHEEDGSSILTGQLQDMAAVYGLILRLRDSGISLCSIEIGQCDPVAG